MAVKLGLYTKMNENKVPRRKVMPKREKSLGNWRNLHHEEPHKVYTLPNIIRVITSRRMRWTRHVVRMEGM
jgi:hypothetical protein